MTDITPTQPANSGTLLATHTTKIYSDGTASSSETAWADGNVTTEVQSEQLSDALQGALNTLQKQRANRYFDERPLGGVNAHVLPYVEPIMQATQRPSRPQPASPALPVANLAGTFGASGTVTNQQGVGFPPPHPGVVQALPANATAEQVAAYNADQAARAKEFGTAEQTAAGQAAIQAAQARDSAHAAAIANTSAPVVVK